MIVRECMTEHPITIQSSQSIQSAAKLMRDRDIGVLPVLLEDKLVGILTDRDVVVRGSAAGLNLGNHQVQEIMSSKPRTAAPDIDIGQAADIMAESKIRRLPIVTDGKLVGLVSLGDIVVSHEDHNDLCAETLEQISKPTGPK